VWLGALAAAKAIGLGQGRGVVAVELWEKEVMAMAGGREKEGAAEL
jgi:hypothetical protein